MSNWSALFANVIVAFLLTPYVVHTLGDTRYGVWALVLQLTGYMGTFDVGMRSALVRFVAGFSAKKDTNALGQLFAMALLFNLLMAVLSLAVGALIAGFALPRMNIPSEVLHESQVTVFLAAATMAAGFAIGMFKTVLAGLSRWDLVNGVGIVTLIVRSGLIVLFLHLGFGIISLAAIHFLTSTAGYLVNWLQVRRLLPDVRTSLKNIRWDYLRPVFTHSWYALLISGANRINYEVDAIVIAAFLPISEVTAYVLGFRLVQYLRELINASAQIVAPITSELEAGGESGKLSQLFLRGSKFCFLVNHFVLAGLVIFGGDFIGLWIGESYMEKSGTVLLILLIGQLILSSDNVPAHILYGLGKHRANAWFTGIEAVLNLGLSVLLVQRYGIYGVAAGTVIGVLIVRGVLFPRYFLRLLKVPWGTYLRAALLPSVVPSICFVGALFVFRALVPINGYGDLILGIMLGLILYVPALWIWGLDQTEKEEFRVLWAKVERKIRILGT